MKSASGAILKAGENPRFLGGKTGCVAVLHTWGQALTYHPHVHLLVPAGGFDTDLMEWIKTDKKFFAPVKVLSSIFRGIFAENICKYAGKLMPQAVDTVTENALLRKLVYKSNWNVFVKPALNNAEKVIEYLGRYTRRAAISNARILDIKDALVRFIWKDYRNNGRTGIMELDGIDFISRFMMHILPDGFYKVRYYGIFAARYCSNTVDTWVSLNDRQMDISAMEGKTWQEIVQEMFGYDPFRCNRCNKGKMLRHTPLDAEPRAA